MPFSIATWNINSVRLRMPIVERLLDEHPPDILCLQETKCPDELFPAQPPSQRSATSTSSSTARRAITASRRSPARPLEVVDRRRLLRHRRQPPSVGDGSGRRQSAILLHNFYVPAGGDEPDPADQSEIRPQARFRRGDERCIRAESDDVPAPRSWSATSTSRRSSTTSGRTSNCSRSSATRRSRPRASRRCASAGDWVDLMRHNVPPEQKLYTWWSYRAHDWAGVGPRPPARPRLVVGKISGRLAGDRDPARGARLGAAVRPRPGDRALRSLELSRVRHSSGPKRGDQLFDAACDHCLQAICRRCGCAASSRGPDIPRGCGGTACG